MEKLNLEEILKIPALLLSSDEANQTIAVQLLEQHPYAISSILAPIEVFLAFHSEYKLLATVKQVFPNFKIEESPIYLIYLIANENDYLQSSQEILKRFSINELNYRTWLLNDPQRAITYASVGEAFCQQESLFEKGLIYYQFAIKNSSKNTASTLSYLELLQKKYTLNNTLDLHKTEIIACYNQTYEAQTDQEILYHLALFYQEQLNEKTAATATWERCIQAHPKFNRAFFVYAQFQVTEKKWDRARTLAQESLNLALSGAYYSLDEIYYLLGSIEWHGFQDSVAAEKYFEKALEENEFYFKPLEALMELSLENEDYTKAIRWHKVALQEIPFDIPLMLKLAELYLEIYDLEQAEYYYTEILELNATYPPALEGLRNIKKIE
jgi:tetratricopeptide (TPR) repeat protein